ncbi:MULTISPECIES: translation elongation factor Ts [Fusobacterium]|uniref:translation elongation factor Ts n=1 Tax=Fusobacterium TaxID=848 RepID=UPI0014775D60|nr:MULTISPECIES: translation elongation factor Ts [Fusobacterium]NME36406.1 elongation factor Ts [Fusobacterium sp. FSA-380-WT-3A]
MAITAQAVKELREMTGAGMMDCKKALTETNGDMDKAIDYLREKGMAKAVKKAGRIAAEGLIFDGVTPDHKTAVVIEFNAETDFVAKNDEFKNFGKTLVEIALNTSAMTVEELKAQTLADGRTVEQALVELIAKIGENMNIRRMEKVVAEGFVTTYNHLGGKLGVIVELSAEMTPERLERAKGIAMHIAAMNPSFLNSSQVTTETLEHEKEIARKQLEAEGKPAKIIENILVGKMKKFYEENCLVNQVYVRAENKETVEQFAGDMTVVSFTRYKVGEGIEKKVEDFAAEVAAQIKG